MDRGEGIIRWSPDSSKDDFLTVDFGQRVIQLYKATGKAVPDRFDYEYVTRYVDHPAVTAYDWSSKIHGLVALGTKTGEVHLARIDDDSNDYIILPPKLQRTCQAVSFNNEGLLAVGLDRVRNDQCLQIWDINQRLQKWDPSKVGWQSTPNASTEPVYKLEPSVAVASARFFHDQPKTLVVGIKNQSVRIHDLRDPHGAVISFQTRCNNNLTINHADPNYFASSSLDLPSVMIWDRRAGSRQSCSKTYLDSVDSGEVPWGCALKLNAVINPNNDSYIRSLRFCRDQAGLLGVLSSSGEMQLLHLEQEYEENPENAPEDSPQLLELRESHDIEYPFYDDRFGYPYDDRIVSFDWITLGSEYLRPRFVTKRCNQKLNVVLFPSLTQNVQLDLVDFSANAQYTTQRKLPQFEDQEEEEQILGPILDTSAQIEAEFGASKNLPQSAPTLKKPTVPEATATEQLMLKHAFEINEHLGLVKREKTQEDMKPASQDKGLHTDVTTILSDKLSLSGRRLSSREQHEEQWATAKVAHKPGDVSFMTKTMLSRIRKGYLFDCLKNQDLVSDDRWLQDLWTWIEGAEDATKNDGMISGGINLAYWGVYPLWNHDLGAKPGSRLASGSDEKSSFPSPTDFSRAIEDINKRAGHQKFEGVRTEKPHHRQLGLAICGWGKSSSELDAELKDMEAQQQYTKAAAWALIEKDATRAVQVLKRGGRELLFIAMALDLHSKGAGSLEKEDWEQALQEHPQMAEDPYLRAIYSLISTGDWLSIANEESLPLRDRIAVALRNFPDLQLTGWLNKQRDIATKTGDIEAIVLFGITDLMVDVFAKYITIFNDYQTATLVMSFAAPLYIEDIRFNQWRKIYQELHNINKLFIQRCKFDVASTMKSRRRDGTTVIKPNPRQVTLRCLHCDTAYTNDTANTASGRSSETAVSNSTKLTLSERNPLYPTGVNAGVSCPKCGRHLPRCAVCLMTLGQPRSDRPNMNVERTTEKTDHMSKFLSFCLKCDHALHADHSRDWFKIHNECPVPECHCRCNEAEGGIKRSDKDLSIERIVEVHEEAE